MQPKLNWTWLTPIENELPEIWPELTDCGKKLRQIEPANMMFRCLWTRWSKWWLRGRSGETLALQGNSARPRRKLPLGKTNKKEKPDADENKRNYLPACKRCSPEGKNAFDIPTGKRLQVCDSSSWAKEAHWSANQRLVEKGKTALRSKGSSRGRRSVDGLELTEDFNVNFCWGWRSESCKPAKNRRRQHRLGFSQFQGRLQTAHSVRNTGKKKKTTQRKSGCPARFKRATRPFTLTSDGKKVAGIFRFNSQFQVEFLENVIESKHRKLCYSVVLSSANNWIFVAFSVVFFRVLDMD